MLMHVPTTGAADNVHFTNPNPALYLKWVTVQATIEV